MQELPEYQNLIHLPVNNIDALYDFDLAWRIVDIEDRIREITKLYSDAQSVRKTIYNMRLYGCCHTIPALSSSATTESLNMILSSGADYDVVMEGIGSTLRSILTAIRTALERLWDWLHTDSFFSRWTNKNEHYIIKINSLLSGPARNYALVNSDAFLKTEMFGYSYDDFSIRFECGKEILALLKTMTTSTTFNTINIEELFGAPLKKVGFLFVDGSMRKPASSPYRRMSLSAMRWSPSKVIYFGKPIVDDLLTSHTLVDSLLIALKKQIKNSIVCVDRAMVDKNDTDITPLQDTLAGLQCVRVISEYTLHMIGGLAHQWVSMVELFSFSVV